jgi:hypothetical protein
MPATVIINRWTGTSGAPTKTPITSINTRANAEDAHSTAGTTNSILIPTSGTNYSYWVSSRLNVTAITGGTVNNVRWYTDGTNTLGTGVTCKVATSGTYAQAPGTVGTSGTQMTVGNYSTAGSGAILTTPTDAFTYTSAAPLSVNGSNTATGDFGDFVVYQIEVGTTASSGASGSETFTFKYDDTST